VPNKEKHKKKVQVYICPTTNIKETLLYIFEKDVAILFEIVFYTMREEHSSS